MIIPDGLKPIEEAGIYQSTIRSKKRTIIPLNGAYPSNVNFPRERKDEKFLACAVVSEADFLMTGDRDFEEMQALLPNTIIISVVMFKQLAIDAVDG